ncbi:MAG: hypothetical protein HY319_23850 [Armatimonadetes bacterium]|nr:hypothetical protein [Armatimonadota bacterium]
MLGETCTTYAPTRKFYRLPASTPACQEGPDADLLMVDDRLSTLTVWQEPPSLTRLFRDSSSCSFVL